MNSEKLIQMTQNALTDQEILSLIFNQCFQYDKMINESFNGDYSIIPELIFPIDISHNSAVALVRVKIERNKNEKMYSFIFNYNTQGLSVELIYPGNTNADVILFNDVYPSALSQAAGLLSGDKLVLKETILDEPPSETGWSETWVWINETGEVAKTKINFNSGTGVGGVIYSVKQAA